MKTKQLKYSYIEWISAEEIHSESLKWLSELKFARDEQRFLNNLIKSYTLQLVDPKIFQKSKALVNALLNAEKELVSLFKKVQLHENQLKIMVDDVDQIKMEKAYQETHRDLAIALNEYFEDYRGLKEQLFKMISQVMEKEKQKKLL